MIALLLQASSLCGVNMRGHRWPHNRPSATHSLQRVKLCVGGRAQTSAPGASRSTSRAPGSTEPSLKKAPAKYMVGGERHRSGISPEIDMGG